LRREEKREKRDVDVFNIKERRRKRGSSVVK
jgi:hypothetical protein